MNLEYPKCDKSKANIAIIQPGCFGDNFNSTIMFEPLCKHFNQPIMHVYTSTLYKSPFINNPYVTAIKEVHAESKNEALNLVHVFPQAIENCGYDVIINAHPMINGDKWTSIKHGEAGTNLICAWMRALENLDVPYDYPVKSQLFLKDREISKVHEYMRRIPKRDKNILMEVSGESGQTQWNHHWTAVICSYLLTKNYNLFISRKNHSSDIDYLKSISMDKVHFVGEFSLRECAEIYNHCDAFFSISSGLANACCTNWCKTNTLWIETVNSEAVSSKPHGIRDKHFWYKADVDEFLEFVRTLL